MATIVECDRCRLKISSGAMVYRVTIRGTEGQQMTTVTEYDLCKDCHARYVTWVNTLADSLEAR